MWAIRIYAHLSLTFSNIVFRIDCYECTLVTQRRRVDNDNGRNAPDFVARTISHLIKIQFADSSLRQIIDYVIQSSLIISRYYLFVYRMRLHYILHNQIQTIYNYMLHMIGNDG